MDTCSSFPQSWTRNGQMQNHAARPLREIKKEWMSWQGGMDHVQCKKNHVMPHSRDCESAWVLWSCLFVRSMHWKLVNIHGPVASALAAYGCSIYYMFNTHKKHCWTCEHCVCWCWTSTTNIAGAEKVPASMRTLPHPPCSPWVLGSCWCCTSTMNPVGAEKVPESM